MTNDELNEFFRTHEWYDNSQMRVIRGCKRKAFFSLIGPRGVRLAAIVGDGANFGSCFHAGLQRYYNGWGKFSENIRRVHGARAFADEWGNYFPTEHIQSKHRLDRGLNILDAYFSYWLPEDDLYQPVESELGFAVEIVPQTVQMIQESGIWVKAQTKPFYYVGRIDGIFRRVADDTFWLRETKTCGQMAEKRLGQLKFDNQPVGYVDCVRKLQPNLKISGFLGDVILIAAQKLEFQRNYFPTSQRDCDQWRDELINEVIDWRARLARAQHGPDMREEWDLSHFQKDTERCFDYGKCSFYELCDYGINDESIALFEPNTWHPLIQRTPEVIIIQ